MILKRRVFRHACKGAMRELVVTDYVDGDGVICVSVDSRVIGPVQENPKRQTRRALVALDSIVRAAHTERE